MFTFKNVVLISASTDQSSTELVYVIRKCAVDLRPFRFIRTVKILQLPVVQQLILPRPLVAADEAFPGMAADEPVPTKPDMKPPKDTKKQMDEKGPASAKETKSKASQDEQPARSFLIPRTRSLPGCPLCDASVYSYCDEKVYHDACCCGSINGAAPPYGGGFGGFGGPGGGFGGPGGGFGGFGAHGGGGCGYQGCSYLYANTCYEHQLIVNCCCNSPYEVKIKAIPFSSFQAFDRAHSIIMETTLSTC